MKLLKAMLRNGSKDPRTTMLGVLMAAFEWTQQNGIDLHKVLAGDREALAHVGAIVFPLVLGWIGLIETNDDGGNNADQ